MSYDVRTIRAQFPLLQERIAEANIVYLDSAATSQKPNIVLEAMHAYYTQDNANINRGMHILAERSTEAYEKARASIARYVGARHNHEIVITRNTTESINLVAKTWGRQSLGKGDRIALSVMEHHSNIVPWLQLKEERGIGLTWIDVDSEGRLNREALTQSLSTGDVKLVVLTGLSNVLGTLLPMQDITREAHHAGALVLIDGAQLIAHQKVNVTALDCDFLAFSGHKIYGPTGIGVLYGKNAWLEEMPPFLGGGDMINTVRKEGFEPAELPRKFEAGTPPVAEAVGLRAAIEWIEQTNMDDISAHEDNVLHHACAELLTIPNIRLLGSEHANNRKGCVSFVLPNIHAHDLTALLGQKGICLRAGHHCTQPLHTYLNIQASTRLSVAAYSTIEEIDLCIAAIKQAQKKLRA